MNVGGERRVKQRELSVEREGPNYRTRLMAANISTIGYSHKATKSGQLQLDFRRQAHLNVIIILRLILHNQIQLSFSSHFLAAGSFTH